MPRRLGAYHAVGSLALTVIAGAPAARPTTVIYQATKSGPGAYVYVGLSKPSTAYILRVTTKPSGLPLNVSWSMSCGNLVVRTHGPYQRLVRCGKLTTIVVLAQLSNTPAGSLSLSAVTGSHVSGTISLVVSIPKNG